MIMQGQESTGAAALLDQMEVSGISRLFASPIAVMAPVWEELVRREGKTPLHYHRCRHELLAVALASGYYQITGEPQVVFLPTNLGVQNGSMGLRSAMQDHVPMVVISMDSLSWGEDPATDPGLEWPSLLAHAAGPARSGEAVVKWAREVRTASAVLHEWRRAHYMARAIPRGPTLLEVPVDLLMGPASPLQRPSLDCPGVVAPEEQILRLADLLLRAVNPIIRTDYAGRTDQGRKALLEIAEILQAPVYEFFMPSHHSFPRSHPLHGAGAIEAVIAEADVILLAGVDAPWHPPLQTLKPDCAVVHVAEDPLRPRSSYWGYATTHTLAGDVPGNLAALARALRAKSHSPPDRTERWTGYLEKKRSEQREQAQHLIETVERAVAAPYLFQALHDALPEDTIFVDEIVCQIDFYLSELFRRKPFRQVRGWHGALGTGLGVALGVRLACPESMVVCIIGDGAWHYNPVPAALGFSQEYATPLFIVVCNNGQYASQTANLQKFYPNGAAVQEGNCVGNVIHPMPDYFKAAEGYGGAGERISHQSALTSGILRALQSVKSGQTYILDVLVTP